MTSKDPTAPGFKQKAKHEFMEFAMIALYLAFFFCALVTYTILLLRKYDVSSDALNYTLAIINALVIAKIILIGELMHLGRRTETRPLYQSVLLKSVLFGMLFFLFHLLEEFVKRLIHGEPSGTVLRNIHIDEMIARSIVIFCAFVPLFGFRELRRVMGEEKLHGLFFRPRAATGPDLSARD